MKIRALLLGLALGALCSPGAARAEDPAAALALMRPKPAQPARDFQVTTLEGRPLRLSTLKGKVVFLNFWATWCKPCEEEMPAMERLYRMYKDQGLAMLAVSTDVEGAAVVAPFVKKHKLTFPVGLDPKMEVVSLYGIWALPSTFIIDKAGTRALFANGPREWDGKAARALFESMLR